MVDVRTFVVSRLIPVFRAKMVSRLIDKYEAIRPLIPSFCLSREIFYSEKIVLRVKWDIVRCQLISLI